MGYLGDKYSKKLLLSGLYFLRGITLILFIFLPASNLSAVLFGTSFGLLWLATVPATNGIVAQIFGTKNLSLLFGLRVFKPFADWPHGDTGGLPPDVLPSPPP